jgi:ParB-like chromosome segregation protein Spo0J
MKTEKLPISSIKANPNNPRIIRDDKFNKLVDSIKAFPQMLEIRPIVVNDDLIVLGGNMRLKACKEAGMKTIPVIKASGLTEDQHREFIIKDNIGFGDWDWQMIAAEWNTDLMTEWGLDVPQFDATVDYSILDEEDLAGSLSEMADGVKKAIQIEFEPEHYEEAYQLVKFWRERGGYVGGMIMEYLKAEKEKL